MNFNLFTIDSWWKAVFIVGLIACVGSVLIEINFIDRKHLFGLGLGMLFIGVSNWMASKTEKIFLNKNVISNPYLKHNLISIILIIIGIFLTGFFGFLIVKGLI